MKPHFKDGPSPIVREQVEALLSQPYRMSGGFLSAAQSWLQAANLCWANQLDLDPPETPATLRIAELRKLRDYKTLNREYTISRLSFESEQEQRNVTRYNAMRRWAAQPSNAELQAEQLKQAEQAAHEAAVEARALAIVAEQNRAALEKARVAARKEIEAQQ